MTDEPSYGQNQPTSPTSPHNALRFAIEQAQNSRMCCTIVKIKKVTTKGDIAPIGRVDVQPMVQMVDGIAKTVDHDTIYNLPYVRMVGGKNAVIIDPKKDDIGLVVFADRDISAVKKTKKVSPPGSRRRNNMADGMFVGSVLSEEPENVIRFKEDGTIIASVGGKSSPCEMVVAKGHVQMKKKGSSSLHITVDADGGQLIAGQAIVLGPDPYPND